MSGQGLYCLVIEFFNRNIVKVKLETPKSINGFIQMLSVDKSTGQKVVINKRSAVF